MARFAQTKKKHEKKNPASVPIPSECSLAYMRLWFSAVMASPRFAPLSSMLKPPGPFRIGAGKWNRPEREEMD
jgi:hypothetical protein